MQNLLLVILLLVTVLGKAQDQLFKKDNSKIDVKILEINPLEIKYKLFTYQDGPIITISKKDVALIIYQNGVHEVMNNTPEPLQIQSPTIVYRNEYVPERIRHRGPDTLKFKELTSTKNLMLFNILDPLNGSFNISYLREFANNYLNFYIPVSAGFASPYFTQATNSIFVGGNYNYNSNTGYSVSDYRYTNKTIEVGLGIHFQTSGKRAVTHFVGPYVGMAQFTGSYVEHTYYNNSNYGNYNNGSNVTRTFVMDRVYVMIDNGVLFRVTKNFNIMMMAGIGYHIDTYKSNNPTGATNTNNNALPLNAFKCGLSFGYRF